MKMTQLAFLRAMPIAVMIAVLLTVCWWQDEAAAQETKKDTRQSNTSKTESKEGDAVKTRKASCRCGKLSVTYKGPDPERITLCHCNSCQLRTGTAFSIQGRFPREHAKIEGKSTKWTGTTVYWDIHAAPDVIGIAIGTLTDPTFPPPKISGFEKYGHPWAMKAADLPIIRLQLAE
jgi:hypothetical protein